MDTPALEPNPTALPTGTQVGAWRITGTRGRGTYGTVYSAVSLEHGHSGPVALKLAVYPADPRFEREAELLSRIRHPSVPRLLDSGLWRAARPPRQLNPRVDAQLNALILRMLSPIPEEQRGAAGELAEALERGVAHGGPPVDALLFEWETQQPSEWTEEERTEAEQLGHRPRRRDLQSAHDAAQSDTVARTALAQRKAHARSRTSVPGKRLGPRRWLPWLVAALALGLQPGETDTEQQPTVAGRQPEPPGDAVSLGDTALNPSAATTKDPAQKAIVLEVPKQPRPGQLRPDAKGRCPDKQIAINGGCWAKVDVDLKYCHGNAFTYQGGCYMPINASGPVPTSAPSEQ
jgi:hypothetical protein